MPGERRIKGWKLLPRAAADLDAIWDYTADTWSVDQAESYLSGIEHTLELLVAHPELGPEHQEINPPVRLHPHRSHLIIYRLEAEFVIVLRIGHMRQHWRAAPAGRYGVALLQSDRWLTRFETASALSTRSE